MFTGIVEEIGTVMEVAHDADVVVVRIEGGPAAAGLAVGGSIAVNGCCLTAVEVKRSEFTCHLTAETLSRTSFGAALHPGARVNLERPMPADGRFDGHIVQGHVDGVGKVVRLTRRERAAELVVAAPARLARYLVEKGSVAVDGVSLTVAAVRGTRLHRRVDPVYTGADEPPRGPPGHAREPGGGRHREVRRAPAGPPPPGAIETPGPCAETTMKKTPSPFSTIPEAIEDIRQGRMVVVVDDEDRENEGDLTIAASKVTPDVINFMARYGRGLDLPAHDRRAAGRPAHPAHGARREQRRQVRHRVLRPHRGQAGHDHRHLGRRTAPGRCWPRSIPRPSPPTSPVPATCSRCGRCPGACWCAPGRPRPRSTSPGWPGFYPAGVICEVMDEDGTMARGAAPRAVLPRPLAEADHHQGPHPAPDAARSGWSARRRRPACPPATGPSASTPSRASSTGRRTSPS